MQSRFIGVLMFVIFSGGLGIPAALGAETTNYTGHYETPTSKTDWSFSLDITQKGSKATVSFSAGMADGSGAAPDGDGGGNVDKTGALRFTFTDSFGNQGAGILIAGKDGYHLEMNVSKTVEPRALLFYQDMVLMKKSNKPASS